MAAETGTTVTAVASSGVDTPTLTTTTTNATTVAVVAAASAAAAAAAALIYFRSEFKETILENGERQINEWLLGRRLGSGAFASVRLATHITSGHVAAIKRMSKSKLRSARSLQKVRREIEIMESLHHANITPLWGVIEEDDGDQLCLVLAYQEKGSLMEWDGDSLRYKSRHHTITSNGGIDESILRPIFYAAAQALVYLRQQHVVHRDIKPENILISATGVAKLADFGVAHKFDDGKDDGIVRDIAGTAHFFSPECCATQTISFVSADSDDLPPPPPSSLGGGGMMPVSPAADSDELPGMMDGPPPPMPSLGAEPPSASAAYGPPYNAYSSDIWAFGVTLYTCIFGVVPWLCSDGNRDVLFKRIQTEPFTIPSSATISDPLRKLMSQLLEKDSKLRLTHEQLLAHEWFSSCTPTSSLATTTPHATTPLPSVTAAAAVAAAATVVAVTST